MNILIKFIKIQILHFKFISPRSTQGVYGGIMRGFGRQHIGALAIFCGYFVVGLPVGIVLMYYTYLEVTGEDQFSQSVSVQSDNEKRAI